MDFTDKILSAVADFDMLQGGDEVVAALSGGADSVSLLFALTKLSQKLNVGISACHVNHNLRGADSDSDMLFCESLCQKLGVKLSVLNIDVRAHQQKHESLEECARRLRYDFFAEVSAGKKIATAHNSNDCAETMLLNLMRGTGLKGLCGIPPKRGNIIRPLIYCTRAEVEAYCGANVLSYCTDKTNFDTDYTRNKVRHIIIPEMLKVNGSFYNTAMRAMKNLREDSDYLEELAADAYETAKAEGGYSAQKLIQLPKPIKSRVVRIILSEGGIEPSAQRIDTTCCLLESGGKYNPCLNKFVIVKRGILHIETDIQHYKNRK